MKDLTIESRKMLKTKQGYQFIPIGDPDKIFGNGGLLDQFADRLFRRNNSPVEDFWATLGRQDGQQIDWSGALTCSRQGNLKSTGSTGAEVDLIKKIYPGIAANQATVKEKVIAFDKTKFGPSPGSRKIRMTIMVDPNEHALVFIQHSEPTDATSQAGVLEYVMPDDDYDQPGRDRMTYQFEVPAFSANTVPGGSRFVLKVLTFRRDIPLGSQLLKPLDTPYGLLNFNPVSNAFEPIPDATKIDHTKKTLLLIHGTISHTDKSYGKLRLTVEPNGKSWLQNVLAGGKYQQIIGFDHPTIIESPLDNAAQLGLRLQGKKFSDTVDIITSSRGGLVGKSVVNNKAIHQDLFQVERAAPVACANGVGYFTVAENIARFLSVARAVADEPTAKLILGLAQQGVTFIINQPGLEAMNPKSKVLNQILNIDSPANTAMRYMPVCGDFKPDPNAKFTTKVLDAIIGKMLNVENDWVVGTNEQAIMPPAYYAYGKNHDYYYNLAVNARHLSYFDPAVTSEPKQRIYQFLHQPYTAIV